MLARNHTSAGWVYILTNPAFPHLLKIGCTGRTPEIRAAELTAATGVPARFAVAWAAPVSDFARCEALVHARLDRCRSNQAREFFRCDVAAARRAIEDTARDLLRPWWWRLLFLPRRQPRRLFHGWRRSRWGSDGLIVGGLVVALVAGVVWLKPSPASWMPAPVARVVVLLEGR